MSSGTVNKAIILGFVGKDPEVKRTEGGFIIANLSVATTEVSGSKEKGTQQRYSEWHKIVAFSKLAEIIEKYVHKGDKIYVEGKFQSRKWQTKDGQERVTTEIIADRLQFIQSKRQPEAEVRPSVTAPLSQNAPDFNDDIPW